MKKIVFTLCVNVDGEIDEDKIQTLDEMLYELNTVFDKNAMQLCNYRWEEEDEIYA